MPDNETSPVIGDGVVTVTLEEEFVMDVPASYGAMAMAEIANNLIANNRDGRNIGTIAMGALQAGVARVHNELSTEESRAISGVMATPIAPPTSDGKA